MQELWTLLEELYHSIDVGSSVYSTVLVCKERGMLFDDILRVHASTQMQSVHQ